MTKHVYRYQGDTARLIHGAYDQGVIEPGQQFECELELNHPDCVEVKPQKAAPAATTSTEG
ncbi:MAG: hypothetical protein ACYDAY_11420 [Candidatus Dormibacteria bacterium]